MDEHFAPWVDEEHGLAVELLGQQPFHRRDPLVRVVRRRLHTLETGVFQRVHQRHLVKLLLHEPCRVWCAHELIPGVVVGDVWVELRCDERLDAHVLRGDLREHQYPSTRVSLHEDS